MRLSKVAYDELLAMLCPYCKHGIGSHFNPDRGVWLHSLEGTRVQGETCGATGMRGKIDVLPAMVDE